MSRQLPAAAALALVLATLASTSARAATKPAGAGKPSSATASTRGLTSTSIKVAGMGYSLLYGDADIGAKARFQRANDAGGVNGRTIDYSGFTDDGGEPALDTQAATTLVQQNQVFALVPTITPDLAASDFLVKHKVPYFGWGLSTNFCGNDYGFAFSGCLAASGATSNAWGLLVAKAFGAGATGKTAAILTEKSTSGQYDLQQLTAGVRSAKLQVVYGKSTLPVPASGDYSAVVGEVLTSNQGNWPDSVFVTGSFSSVVGIQQALRAAGYLGLFTNLLEYDPNLVAPAIGSYVMVQTAAVETAETNPAMQRLVADVRKIAPDQPINQAVIAGYFSADLFVAAVQKAGKKLSVDRLLKAANHEFTYAVSNTVGPTKFPAAHNRPTPCGSLVSSNGVAFAVKVPYSCGKVVAVK